MAQYFQVVDQSTSGEELQATYPNLVDQQGVHYIIQASDTNQTFVLDNVLEQPVIQLPQQQQVYLVSSPPRPQQTMQPVVLNHTLQQQVFVSSTQPLRGMNRAAAIVQRPRTTVGLVTTPRLAARGVIQANRPRVATPRPAITAPEPATIQGNEMIKLEDGRLLTVADYQKLLQRKKLQEQQQQQQQQQQQALRTLNPQQRAGMIRPVRPGPPRPAARAAVNARSGAPRPQRMPTPQATQPKKSTARIIQPNQSAIMPKILRNFSVSKEIKDIINKNGNDEEFENSIRMYVLLAGGEQRLITFTTPKEDCTIQEILEQVGVAVDNNTKIGFNEIKKDGIDIVVSVGYDDEEDDPSAVEEPPPKKLPARAPPPKKPFLPLHAARVPSPVLEPELPPKFIPGKMAVCTHCGYVSEDFNKCQRCFRKLPENIKSVSSDGVLGAKKIEINLKPRLSAPNNGTVAASSPASSAGKPVVRKKPARKAVQDTENMVVTLSSDEEDDDASNDKPSTEAAASDKEPTMEALTSAEPLGLASPTTTASCTITCRKIRVGSHRFTPDHDIALNAREMIIKVPHTANRAETVTITIARQMIHKVLVSFQKNLPIIFMYVIPAECARIAAALGMTPGGECYFSSIAENQLHRRIVLLPTTLGPETKSVLQTVFGDPSPLEEINSSEANAILLKTSKDVTGALFTNAVSTAGVRQLLIYPPGKGGISINTEDFMCLERDQFLNDVIIDFYLKYMVDQMPEAQRAKVQVFSTFFYTRLTTKPARNLRRVHPSELDSNLTAAQKRHSRVKNWTKNIDLFEKDYIIVPINENAHWFLAIICFPGLREAETFDGVKVKKEFCKRAPQKRISSLVKTTPPLMKALKTQVSEIEDNSDKDEAEGDDSEFEIDEAEEPTAPAAEVVPMSEVPIKQPCILIFDSLAGAGRSRVVATLRDYLTCEYAAKKMEAHVFTKDVIPGACPKIPQQNNYTDCGLYLLQYVEHFFKDPIRDYRIPILGVKEWFAEIVVTRKREDIANLIKALMVKYKKNVSSLPTIALPTQNGVPVPDPSSDKEEDDAEDAKGEQLDAESIPGNTHESSLTDTDTQMSYCESNSPCSESSDKSNRQSAMSYLKAKRIVKVKADTTGDSGEETKRRKVLE